MNAPREEERVAGDEDGIHSRSHEGGECRVDLILGAGFADVQSQIKRVRRRLHVGHLGRDIRISRVDQESDRPHLRQQLAQQLEPLRGHGIAQPADPRHVSARTIKAGHQAELHRVAAGGKHDGNDRRRSLGGNARRGDAGGGDDRNLTTDQIGGKRRQIVILALRPAILDRNIAALNIADSQRGLPGTRPGSGETVGENTTEIPISASTAAARAPRAATCRRAAEQRDELAALHSITSSAATSSLSGIVRPIVFAACRLMTSSNLVDCATGKSAGLAPFKIFPV